MCLELFQFRYPRSLCRHLHLRLADQLYSPICLALRPILPDSFVQGINFKVRVFLSMSFTYHQRPSQTQVVGIFDRNYPRAGFALFIKVIKNPRPRPLTTTYREIDSSAFDLEHICGLNGVSVALYYTSKYLPQNVTIDFTS